jgi:hypothetical protein
LLLRIPGIEWKAALEKNTPASMGRSREIVLRGSSFATFARRSFR